MEMIVRKTADFELTGDGTAPQWQQAEWQPLQRVKGEAGYAANARVLYSERGIYFLVDCEDKQLTCKMTEDFDNIFTEDVVEVFLWPHQPDPFYFEYEISPLGVELPILVGNHEGLGFMGWRPWKYDGDRKTRKATAARGGEKKSMAAVDAWTVEFFIPFALLKGLGGIPARSGDQWRANIYRIDYDAGTTQWCWDPNTGANFHNYRQFGTFKFD